MWVEQEGLGPVLDNKGVLSSQGRVYLRSWCQAGPSRAVPRAAGASSVGGRGGLHGSGPDS